jgi:hypothetical protein
VAKPLLTSRTILAKVILIGVAAFYRPLYDWIKETPEVYFVLDFVVTIITRWITKGPVTMRKHDTLIAILITILLMSLTGCASFPDIANVVFGKSSQKITRDPIYVYRPDIRIGLDGEMFEGMAVTELKDENSIYIESLVDIDRVEVSSCSRHDVCQVKAGTMACDPTRFRVETDWFRNAGKKMLYVYRPSEREREGNCSNLTIAIYDKKVLAAWGYVAYRANPERNFPARMSCNAVDWRFKGLSLCSAKAGHVQRIYFDPPVEDFEQEPGTACNLKKISMSEFEFQPEIGWCRAGFFRDGKYHGVTINGYDEVLVREK